MAETPTGQAPAVVATKTNPAAVATPAAEEATETLKVNGKEIKLTKAQVIAAAQKGLFADQKLKSIDTLQKGTTSLLNDLKTPEGFLKTLKNPALGANPKEIFKKLMSSDIIDDELKDEMSKWVYQNVVQQAKKTPEEIERDKKLSEYEKLKAEKEDREKQEMTDKHQAQVQQVYQAIRAEVNKQILDDKTFPQTEGSVRAVIEKLRVMNKQGVPVTSESVTKALGLVKKDHIMHQQALLDSIEDPEGLIALLGEARALKISKALVARLQAKGKTKAAEVQHEKSVKEKVTDRIDKKLGRTPQGYTVLDI